MQWHCTCLKMLKASFPWKFNVSPYWMYLQWKAMKNKISHKMPKYLTIQLASHKAAFWYFSISIWGYLNISIFNRLNYKSKQIKSDLLTFRNNTVVRKTSIIISKHPLWKHHLRHGFRLKVTTPLRQPPQVTSKLSFTEHSVKYCHGCCTHFPC